MVLGGDCSILLGNLLALRALGRYGLVFIAGHDDFTQPLYPERYPGIFAAAGLDLALATGHGPAAHTTLRGFAAVEPSVMNTDLRRLSDALRTHLAYEETHVCPLLTRFSGWPML